MLEALPSPARREGETPPSTIIVAYDAANVIMLFWRLAQGDVGDYGARAYGPPAPDTDEPGMTKENILVIAPEHPDLKTIAATVAAIARYHNVTQLVGNVRESDIQREVDRNGNRIIWFLTHGGRAGMQLTSSVLPPEGVGQYVIAGDFKLCVMSTCDSEDVANRIIAGGDADMVCTITEQVDDEDASRFDVLFAKEIFEMPLVDEPDFEEAFNKAKGPGATKYRYIRAKSALRGLTLQATTEVDRLREKIEGLTNGQYKITVDLQTLTDRFAQMTQQALITQQQAMATQASAGQMANMERTLTASQQPATTFTPMFWMILIAVVGLLIVIVLLLSGRTL